MSQGTVIVANGTGATVRASINTAFDALVTSNSGASAPTTMSAYMLWADTTTGYLKIRNAANSAWVIAGRLANVGLGRVLNASLSKSATYTVVAADEGQFLQCSSTFTLSLTAAATLGDGFALAIANTGVGVITVHPAGSETIGGSATLTLAAGDAIVTMCNGSNWIVASDKISTLPVANGGTGAATLTANYALLGNGTSALQMIAPGASGNFLTSNGTTWQSTTPSVAGDMVLASVQTVTGAKTFGSAGAVGKLIIAGTTSGSTILNATAAAGAGTLTLPTGTDTLVGKATTDTLTNKTVTAPVLSGSVTGTYTLAGTPTITSPTITGATMTTMASSVITSGTTVSPTASTSIDFTSIPSWVKRITVMFYRPTTNGSSIPLIQLGTTSGIETTGYIGYSYNPASSVTSTAGATLAGNWGSTFTINGIATICLLGSNVWAISFTGAFTVGNTVMLSGYSKTVAATLDRVRITTVNGSDVYNSGSVNILYE